MSVSIDFDNVVKKYGNNTIIDGLSLHVNEGEFFTLLGPSGCGKTTLLRMVVGFNSIEGGEISIGGNVINNIVPSKRNIGMVFQNYAVFPHMNVANNVAFGLKNRKVPKAEIAKKVDDILKVVKIYDLKDRLPANLSGGQQQRVALARAIVIHPQVLLMDEPLSNLDAKLRIEMRSAIKKIQNQIGITTIYVTHDQEEALAISDRIAVMNKGVIQQIGTPKHIYQRPANTFVATFIGLSNIINAKIALNGSQKKIVFENGYSECMDNISDDAFNDEEVKVSIRPEEFVLNKNSNGGENEGLKAVVKSSVFLGLSTHYFMELFNGQEIEVIEESSTDETIQDGTTLYLSVKKNKINLFDSTGQKSLIKEVSASGTK